MVFVDGENIVCRYQDMLNEGWTRHRDMKHRPDVYVWNPTAVGPITHTHELLSTTYFTSAVGSPEIITEIEFEMRGLSVRSATFQHPPVTVTPFVTRR